MSPVPKVGLDDAKLAEKINAKIANLEPFPKNFKFFNRPSSSDVPIDRMNFIGQNQLSTGYLPFLLIWLNSHPS